MEFFERTSNELRMNFERNSKNFNQLRIHENFFEIQRSKFSKFEVVELRNFEIRSSTTSNFENFRKFEDVELRISKFSRI